MALAIVIDARPVGSDLDVSLDQLQHYIDAEPSIKTGVAVLTNGQEWRLYDVEGRVSLAGKLVRSIDIIKGNQREAAEILHHWLDRGRRR